MFEPSGAPPASAQTRRTNPICYGERQGRVSAPERARTVWLCRRKSGVDLRRAAAGGLVAPRR
jgi:hypothetical protein